MERLATLLGHAIAAESQQQLETHIKSIDQLLRILDSMNNLPSQSVTEPSVLNARHKLLDLLALALQTVERNLSTTRDGSDLLLPPGISPPQPSHLLKAVMGLLKFTLGSVVSESVSLTAPKPNFPHLAVCFLKAIFVSSRPVLAKRLLTKPQAGDGILDSNSARIMADMLVYIIDCKYCFFTSLDQESKAESQAGTSPQARLVCQSALLAETVSPHAQSILSSFPELSAAMPYLSPVQRHMSLVTPDTADHVSDSALPLDDRRWELFEYIGPSKRKIGPQDLFLASAPLKDASSIPITLFDPKITRDAPPNAGTMDAYGKPAEDGELSPTTDPNPASPVEEEPRRSWETFASERNLGDGLAGEPAYAKQAATLLFSVRDNDVLEVAPVKSAPELVITSSTSPQKPKVKRSGSGKDKATGSNKDAPAAAEEDENDEDSGAEVPLSKKQKTAKNNNAAGKAPARKTTGGKGVSKKATGKSAKEGATGKAKGGRRKSQAE